jgi:lipopolysaccharide/colanic/teichoic acid biosynthesis glycosyltransferase
VNFGKELANVFSIKPGLTGYWQISGRKNLSWEDRVKLELFYLENRRLSENFRIIFRTIPAIFFGRGAY